MDEKRRNISYFILGSDISYTKADCLGRKTMNGKKDLIVFTENCIMDAESYINDVLKSNAGEMLDEY